MKDGRGWYQEPMRHSLAARGIPTQHIFQRGQVRGPLTEEEKKYEDWANDPWLRKEYPTYESYREHMEKYRSLIPQKDYKDIQGRTAHDVIFNMARENTGSHFLDSGMAYGYKYDDPLSEGPLKITDYGFTISTPHWLDAMLDLDENTDRFNEIFDNVVETTENQSWLKDMNDLVVAARVLAENEGVEFEPHGGPFNTYNSENDFDQDFQGQIFYYDGEAYIVLHTHNGCDVRGGYPKPHVFKMADYDYFHFWNVELSGHDPCPFYDLKVRQMTLEGERIRERDAWPTYEMMYHYGEDAIKSGWAREALDERGIFDFAKVVNQEGGVRCPQCGEYHLYPYNPGTHGY